MILNNIKIRYKLRLVIVGQLVLFVVILSYIFSLNGTLDSNVANTIESAAKMDKIRDLTSRFKDFYAGEIDYKTVKDEYGALIEEFGAARMKKLQLLWAEVESVNKIKNNNKQIEKEIFDLTSNSIEQSNKFLSEISKKLAGSRRSKVTTLERLVIAGASVNTNSNYNIQTLYLKCEQDIKLSDELISFIDKSIKNSLQDVESLKNTPFANLPVIATENNKKIKSLVLKYLQNKDLIAKGKHDLEKDITAFNDALNRGNIAIMTYNNDNVKKSIFWVLVILIIVSIFIIVVNIAVANSITKAFYIFINNFNELANGNLNIKSSEDMLNRTDEIGDLARARRKMIDKVRIIIKKVIDGANTIAAAGKELNQSAQAISNGTSTQASSAEEISASMEQMAANITQNNENATETKNVSNKAANEMKVLGITAENSLNSIDKISEKISIINDIAFQTNILALNAAVEAARAGESGKGFAVVASEVRKLAERSKTSALEIEELSESSVKLTKETKKLLVTLVPEIEKTATLVNEIANAGLEQDSGVTQVNLAINQLNDISQQNAGISEELASNAEELSSRAEELKSVISYFRINETDNPENKKKSKNAILDKVIVKEKQKKIKKEEVINTNIPKKTSEKGFNLNLGDSDKTDSEFESF